MLLNMLSSVVFAQESPYNKDITPNDILKVSKNMKQETIVKDNEKKQFIISSSLEDKKIFGVSIKDTAVKAPENIPEMQAESIKDITQLSGMPEDGILVNRIYFGLYDSEENAKKALKDYNDAFEKNNKTVNNVAAQLSSMQSSTFWHNSTVSYYYSSTYGFYYVINLSARDASYVFNVGSVAAVTICSLIGIAMGGTIGAVTGVLLGAVVAIAIQTLYWSCQNSDGSFTVLLPAGNIPSMFKQAISATKYLLPANTYLGGTYRAGSSNWSSYYWDDYDCEFDLSNYQ
jgi:hypothetical protein